MAKQVTMSEFFAHMMGFDYYVEADNDRICGYDNDSYLNHETGREIGFITFHMEEEETFYIHD